jgi:hypothetical protein
MVLCDEGARGLWINLGLEHVKITVGEHRIKFMCSGSQFWLFHHVMAIFNSRICSVG